MEIKTKKQIRKEILALRDSLGREERKRGEILVTERIFGHQLFYSSEALLVFAGYGSEIDTSEIIKEALRLGKKVYLPKVQGEEMEFYRIFSMEELSSGYKGILEPSGDTEKYLYTEEAAGRTMMLMPGVAFDAMRNRIGYGKGFYDKFLQDKEALQLRTIAIGFRCQMTDAIPAEEKDIRPCQVICG